jgi:hypothetical protein
VVPTLKDVQMISIGKFRHQQVQVGNARPIRIADKKMKASFLGKLQTLSDKFRQESVKQALRWKVTNVGAGLRR